MKTGAFVVDLQALDRVRVSPETRIAEVEGGARVQSVTEVSSRLGLLAACGTNPGTGFVGAALSGGYGWLTRTFGYAVDNVVGAEVVLPNGDRVLAEEEGEHADLLWGLRGGGGNFGVVTRLFIRLHPAPPTLIAGRLIHFAPSAAAKAKALRAFDKLMTEAPSGLTGTVVLTSSMFIHTLWCYIGEAKSVSEVSCLLAAQGLGGLAVVRNTLKKRSNFDDVQRLLLPFQRTCHRFDSVVPIGTANELLPEDFVLSIVDKFSKALEPHVRWANLIMFSVGGDCATKDDGVNTCLTEDFRNSRYFAIIGTTWDLDSGNHGKEAARKFCKDIKEICSAVKTIQTTYSCNDLEDDPIKPDSVELAEDNSVDCNDEDPMVKNDLK